MSLIGKRIQLKPINIAHLDEIYSAVEESREMLAAFIVWIESIQSYQDLMFDIQRAELDYQSFQNELRFSLFEIKTQKYLGSIALCILDPSVPSFEIGYWIRKSEVGKGYMTEALTLLTNYSSQKLGAKRIEIKVIPENSQSIAVIERCNYQYEARLRNFIRMQNGQLKDILIFSLIFD